MSANDSNDSSGKPLAIHGLRFQDVEVLLNDRAPARRAKVVQQLAVDIDTGRLSEDELSIALDILRLLATDVEIMVRRSVAISLKASVHLPHEIALKLASDEASVAQPVLESSPVLTDDDLITVLAEGLGNKQVAIARRSDVSAVVAAAVLDTGNAAAVTTLVANDGAELAPDLLERALDRYGRFETVKAAMVHRSELPVTISERLVTLVSDRLKLVLASRHALPADIAADLILEARERATLGLVSDGAPQDTQALVSQLHARGRLTPSLVLRALCMGDFRFVEDAMAEIAGISAEKAALLVHDAGPLGLKAIYKRCRFPEELYAAFRIGVDTFHEDGKADDVNDRDRFSRRVIERILDKYRTIETADLAYLRAKLSKLQAA